MLGNSTQRTYLSISRGKIQHRDKEGNVEQYDTIEGVLTAIRRNTREIGGKETEVLTFDLTDGNDNYGLGCIADSGVARSIIRSLYGVQDFNGVRIKIITRLRLANNQEYTNAFVYADGQQMKWAVDLPQREEFQLPTGEKTYSSKKRDDKFWECVDEINSRISSAQGGTAPAEEAYVEDQNDELSPEEDIPADDYSGSVDSMFNEPVSY